MSLLDTAIVKAEDLFSHLKGLAEADIPKLEAAAQSPIGHAVETGLEDLAAFFLPPQAEQFIASVVRNLVSEYRQPVAAQPADPSAMAPADPAAAPAA